MSLRREDNDQSMEPSGNEQERAALVEEPPSGGGPSQFRVGIPHDSHRTLAAVQKPQFRLLKLRLEGHNVWSTYPENTTTQQSPVTQPSSGTVGSTSFPYGIDRSRCNTPERTFMEQLQGQPIRPSPEETTTQQSLVTQPSSGTVGSTSFPYSIDRSRCNTPERTFMEQLHRQPIRPSPSVGTERRRDRTTEDSERPRESPARELHRSTDGQHREESQPRTDPQLRVGELGRFRVERVEESQGPPSRWTSVKNFFRARIPRCLRGYQCFFLMMSVFICILAALLSWFILYASSHYTGWYCKIEVFYRTLSPNRSVEQILAVERDLVL